MTFEAYFSNFYLVPVWLRNFRRLDRAFWPTFGLLASTLFALVGIAVIINSPEGGDKLFGAFLALLSGVAAFLWFQKLKGWYRESARPDRQICPNCRQEFSLPSPFPQGATPCPYCGHWTGDLQVD